MSRTPALMFQGTSSDAGKSLMTAAFCRILSDEGLKVAPFKAQNMSLNSFVTAEGGEMGRAQVLQAMAARIEPHVLMNPVLLKPTSDQGSQVILRGKPLANLQARQYYDRIETLRTEVKASYDELAADCDAIVLEGAGSPGEVNLKSRDIVNMSMAAHARSGVILVGDIDRGGVYASFIGHLTVMEQWERDLVKGFLVNKFRGDATLLKEAHEYMWEHSGKAVLGVMPWVRDHRLPEEDGVDFEERYGRPREPGTRQEGNSASAGEGRDTVIGVVELPHISNSTDLDPFLGEPGLRLVRIDTPEKLEQVKPDALILPGTRNVIGDLSYLRRRGIVDAMKKLIQERSIALVGICGGFQMLGRIIADPLGLEVAAGTVAEGLNLLNMETVLESDKTLSQRETVLSSDGSKILGYEIHHGRTRYDEEELFRDSGLGCRKARIWGTYLHGIFENTGIRESFLSEIGRNTAPPETSADTGMSQRRTLDEALDSFAEVFRRSVDIPALMSAMEL